MPENQQGNSPLNNIDHAYTENLDENSSADAERAAEQALLEMQNPDLHRNGPYRSEFDIRKMKSEEARASFHRSEILFNLLHCPLGILDSQRLYLLRAIIDDQAPISDFLQEDVHGARARKNGEKVHTEAFERVNVLIETYRYFIFPSGEHSLYFERDKQGRSTLVLTNEGQGLLGANLYKLHYEFGLPDSKIKDIRRQMNVLQRLAAENEYIRGTLLDALLPCISICQSEHPYTVEDKIERIQFSLYTIGAITMEQAQTLCHTLGIPSDWIKAIQ